MIIITIETFLMIISGGMSARWSLSCRRQINDLNSHQSIIIVTVIIIFDMGIIIIIIIIINVINVIIINGSQKLKFLKTVPQHV